jgi:hypothetical protein
VFHHCTLPFVFAFFFATYLIYKLNLEGPINSDMESSFMMQMKGCMIKPLIDICRHQSWEKVKVE